MIWDLILVVAIIGFALVVGQFVFGIVMMVVVYGIMLITLPFQWIYKKIKGEK